MKQQNHTLVHIERRLNVTVQNVIAVISVVMSVKWIFKLFIMNEQDITDWIFYSIFALPFLYELLKKRKK